MITLWLDKRITSLMTTYPLLNNQYNEWSRKNGSVDLASTLWCDILDCKFSNVEIDLDFLTKGYKI